MDGVGSLIAELAKTGTLGIVLVLSILALVKMFGKYEEAQDRRIAEAQANYKIISELTQAIKDLTQAQRERG